MTTLIINDEEGCRLLPLDSIAEVILSEGGARIDIYRNKGLSGLWYRDSDLVQPSTVQSLWETLKQEL